MNNSRRTPLAPGLLLFVLLWPALPAPLHAEALGGLGGLGALGGLRWKIARPSLELVGVVGTLLVGRDGDELVTVDLTTGKKRWGTRIGNLQSGPQTLAADAKGVYALGSTGLYVLAPDSGAIMHTEPLSKPRQILRVGASLYVAYDKGIVRFASGGKKRLAANGRYRGTLQGAEGNVAVLHRLQPIPKGQRGSPQRLTAVDLKTGRTLYEFRLLPTGDHRLIEIGAGRLSFIDYTRAAGKGPPKLFLTEVDYRKNKRLRDIDLQHHHVDARSDRFFALPAGGAAVLLVQDGPVGATSSVLVLDLEKKQVRWQHKAKVPFGAPVIVGGRVWLARGRGATRHLVAYGLLDGKAVDRSRALGAAEVGAPLPAPGSALLVRTTAGVLCLQPGVAPTSRPAGPDPTRGWRLYRDKLAGYTIKLPVAWLLNPRHVRHFGPDAFAVPFVRYQVEGDKWRFQSSVHVLVRPSRGQSVEELWKAVLAQRGRHAPVQVGVVQRRTRNGQAQIIGSYTFRNASGVDETAQSLCVVSHGLAFELRARVHPASAALLRTELGHIFDTFTVRPELRGKP